MANKFTRFINSLPGGPKGIVSNFKHAERIFVDNYYRLAPRTKFLYYVVLRGADKEVSLLVKTADLPKYTFQSTTKNVYNRTKHVYKMMSYEPLTFTFHDDNEGLVNQMWNEYYSYYSDDPGASQSNHPNSLDKYFSSYGMGFPTDENYFKKISLYTLSRQRFIGYELIAPRIKSWTHSNLDYAANEPADNTMTIDYEAVVYSSGRVSYNSPDGFASLSYDVVPSPNTVGGGGLRGLANALGAGVVGDIESIFGPISKDRIKKRPGEFISAAIKSVNAYQQLTPGAKDSFSGIVGQLRNPNMQGSVANAIGGVIGAKFPKVGSALGAAAAVSAVGKLLQTPKATNSFQQASGNLRKPPKFP
jgi:hypothetical protein